MSWTDKFDQIFLINLAKRTDRLLEATAELKKYKIPHFLFRAIENEKGEEGIYETMQEIFSLSLKAGFKRILVFEDDVQFLEDPKPVMKKIVNDKIIMNTYDMLFLGCNAAKALSRTPNPNVLMVEKAYGLHAVSYSYKCMRKILSLPKQVPIDVAYAENIQSAGNCFCTNPMLATQRPSYSDIQKRHVDYEVFLQQRFNERLNELS